MDFEQSGFKRLKIDEHIGNSSSPIGGDDLISQLKGAQYAMEMVFKYKENVIKENVHNMGKLEPDGDTCKILAQAFLDKWLQPLVSNETGPSSKKNPAKSAEYRIRGNQDYERGKWPDAAYLYTMAIIYAPNVSENDVPKDNLPKELSLAFGNRSAVFFALGQYETCLTDIDHAQSTGYPREKISKLLIRKVECLISLTKVEEAKKIWEHLCCSGAEPKDDKRAIKIRLQLLDIDSNDNDQNQKTSENGQMLSSINPMPSVISYLSRTKRYQPSTGLAPLSAKLEPRYSNAKGRHLVAKQDIEAGDILMVESPIVNVLQKKYELRFCHHCCLRLEYTINNDEDQFCINGALIPCTQCTRVLYCSTACRTESWRNYHQKECSILPFLQQMTDFSHLAFRLLLVTGLDVIKQVTTRNSEGNKSNEHNSPNMTDPTDVSAYYEHVFQLMHHQEATPPEELARLAIASAMMVKLAAKCGFVRTVGDAKLAGSTLMRHLLQLYSNSHSIGTVFRLPFISEFAWGLYPFHASLLNHSCYPNSLHIFEQGRLLLQHATKRIPAGTEVTTGYGPNNLEHKYEERQATLWKQYHFKCECIKCVVEPRDGLDGKYFPIGCQKCSGTLTRSSPTSTTFNCSSTSCSAVMSLSEVKRLYTRVESKLANVDRLMNSIDQSAQGGIIDTRSLTKCEANLSELCCIKGMHNYEKLTIVYSRLGVQFRMIQRTENARKYLRKSCDLFEANFGITKELCLSYFRLAEMYFVDGSTVHGKLVKELGQVLKRAMQLLRHFAVADIQRANRPDFLADESIYLWKKHELLAKYLKLYEK